MTAAQVLTALARIPIDHLSPGSNARGGLGDVSELAISIRAIGMQKPLLVCDLGDGRYEILDGHRRHAAALQLGLPHLDCVLRRRADGALRIQQQLAMNAQSKPFDPIAEATALHALMWQHNMTREEISQIMGKSPGWVRDRIGLLQLPPGEREAVAAGRLRIGEALLRVRWRREGTDVGAKVHAPAPRGSTSPHCPTCHCGDGA
jgi:ParB family chromosome partitioning protein